VGGDGAPRRALLLRGCGCGGRQGRLQPARHLLLMLQVVVVLLLLQVRVRVRVRAVLLLLLLQEALQVRLLQQVRVLLLQQERGVAGAGEQVRVATAVAGPPAGGAAALVAPPRPPSHSEAGLQAAGTMGRCGCVLGRCGRDAGGVAADGGCASLGPWTGQQSQLSRQSQLANISRQRAQRARCMCSGWARGAA